ncbi:MAG: hypothetical protein ABIW84_07060 [Ilumatobacteraceae bacterium]
MLDAELESIVSVKHAKLDRRRHRKQRRGQGSVDRSVDRGLQFEHGIQKNNVTSAAVGRALPTAQRSFWVTVLMLVEHRRGRMRWSNVILVALSTLTVGVAAMLAWRWRRLPVVAPRERELTTPKSAALDAVRTLGCVLTAGFIAGVLVVGFGGRLVMRVLGATSGDGAQGRLTEAGETVGEITVGGTFGFFIFSAILIPVAASFLFIPLRRLWPTRAWIAGLVFGVILLGTVGVDDPLSPDNVDFAILSPLLLAVTLVSATAVLFGMTFAALVARLDATLLPVSQIRSTAPWRNKAAYASLIFLVVPLFAIPALVYVAVRVASHGRLNTILDRAIIRHIGEAIVGIAAITSAALVIIATTDII